MIVVEFDALQAITNIRDAMLLDPERDVGLLEDASGLLRWVAERVSSERIRFDDIGPENETRDERRKRLDKLRKRRARHADSSRTTPGQQPDNTRTESGQHADKFAGLPRACAPSEISLLLAKTQDSERKEGTKTQNTPLPLDADCPPDSADSEADTDSADADNIRTVFDHWIRVMEKRTAKLTAGRKTKIRARLRERYSVAQLCQAIDGCRCSEYHMGGNDSATLYNDLETILKSGGSVERHISRLSELPRPRPNGNGASQVSTDFDETDPPWMEAAK